MSGRRAGGTAKSSSSLVSWEVGRGREPINMPQTKFAANLTHVEKSAPRKFLQWDWDSTEQETCTERKKDEKITISIPCRVRRKDERGRGRLRRADATPLS